MNTQQPDALRLAAYLRESFGSLVPTSQAADELERQHARIEALEASEQRHLQELRSYRITVENREARIVELEAQLVKEAARTAEQKLRADQMTEQHAMQAKMHAQAAEQLAAAHQDDALQAAIDMLHTARQELDLLREALNVQVEPHQSLFERMLEAAQATHPTPQGLDAERLRNLLCKMVDQLERRWKYRDGNAPGHRHSIPGVWDGDNGEIAGQKCAWCEVWQEALEVHAAAQAKQGGAA